MKLKLVVLSIALFMPFSANADRYRQHYGHGGHRGGHGNHWIAPAIIIGSAIYGATRNDSDDRPYRRELTQYEIQEEQLKQRELELERREHEYYERQNRARGYDDNCREYYRDDGRSSYYSRNCW